jgi:hypothetical protein
MLLGASIYVEGQNLYTPKEKSALDKFRSMVEPFQTKDYMKSDAYLYRWLKEAKFDETKAAAKFKRMNEWRKENKIETILDENMDEYQKFLPYNIDAVSKEGLPVVQLILGKWQFRKYAIAGKREVILRQWYQMMEKAEVQAHIQAQKTGKKSAQVYFLDDLDGLTVREHLCLPCTPIMYDITRSVAANHPGFQKRITMVNVPRIYLPIMNIVKSLLSEDVAGVINTFGHDKNEWQPIVLNDIDSDQIPPALGGTKKQ